MERTIDPLSTMDAKLWADEFMATKARLGDKEFDHAMMLAWFANAIMVGYDEGQRRAKADAQATVEALQRERDEWRSNAVAQEARANDLERDCKDLQSDIEDERAKVKGLHEITKVICTHCCEPMEIPSKAVLQSALTQRTAERDTARRRVDELEAREVDVVLLRDDLEQRTAELEAAKAQWTKTNAEYERVSKVHSKLHAELERVRGELQSAEAGYFVAERELQGANNKYDELRTLILALPKVEGEIEVKLYGDEFVVMIMGLIWLKCYKTDEVLINAIVALWQHRHGMEG